MPGNVQTPSQWNGKGDLIGSLGYGSPFEGRGRSGARRTSTATEPDKVLKGKRGEENNRRDIFWGGGVGGG